MEIVNLLFDRELTPGFSVPGYRLIPGYSGEVGLPFEAFLRLYAVKDETERVLISGPGDLSPLVGPIKNVEAAWSFLCLFTAPETHYLFQKDVYILDLTVARSDEDRALGEISAVIARKIGFQPPRIEMSNQEYVATRDLVRIDTRGLARSPVVLRRKEGLSASGAYRFIEERAIGEVERKDVTLPAYE